MTKMTYNEYIEQLNQQGMLRMLSDMTEVPDFDAARQASEDLLGKIVENSNLSKAKMRKPSHALAQVEFQGANYLATLYQINGALVMLRATNLDTEKFYIPNKVWMVMTNRETDESELQLIMSLSMGDH